jgi:hypothetical protein
VVLFKRCASCTNSNSRLSSQDLGSLAPLFLTSIGVIYAMGWMNQTYWLVLVVFPLMFAAVSPVLLVTDKGTYSTNTPPPS